MSASTRIKSVGFRSTTLTIRSAHSLARSRSRRADAIRTATRRRFSINASRSISGSAQSSPSLSASTDWYEAMKLLRLAASTRPSTWAINSSEMPYARGKLAPWPLARRGNSRL
jgi:hypothetical protein